MPSEKPDVLVIGASLAGLAAARSAARAGARVVVLDPRDEMNARESPAVVAFDMLWGARTIRPHDDEVRRRLDGMRVQSPSGHGLEIEAALSVLDRARLDARLAKEAEQAGARILFGMRGVNVHPHRRVTAHDYEANPGVLIFADGAGSLARRFFETMRHPYDLLWGAVMRLERPGVERERMLHVTLGSHAPGGRSQLTPLSGDAWAHWTFYRGAPSEARDRARRALDLDVQLRGWDPEIIENARFEGVAPDASLVVPRKLVADGMMATGAAAGQAGIETQTAAGEIAGEVAAACVASGHTDARTLYAYERKWKRDHLSGHRALRRAFIRLSRLDDASLDKLLAPWTGWRVPARDVIGLVHADPVRKAEAAAKFMARNPHAVPSAMRIGARALLPL